MTKNIDKLFAPIILIGVSLILTICVLNVKDIILTAKEANRGELVIKAMIDEKARIDFVRENQKAINKKEAIDANEKGLEYLNNKEYDKAIAEFKKAIELDPLLQHPYNNLGNSYSYQSMHDLAFEYYEKAIEVNPEYAKVYNNIGVEYIKIGHENSYNAEYYKKAKPYLEKSIDINPTDHLPYYNLGRVYHALDGKEGLQYYADAEYNFLKAIELKDDYYYTHRQLGFVYFNHGENEKAFNEWEIAFSLGMEDEEVRLIIENVNSNN